jgi:hypothetical protein
MTEEKQPKQEPRDDRKKDTKETSRKGAHIIPSHMI